MSNNALIFHVNGRFQLKFSRVVRGVENCSLEWVQFGKSWRNLTEEESIAARNAKAKATAPIGFAELPSTIYRPADKDQAAFQCEMYLAGAASQFAAMCLWAEEAKKLLGINP